MQLRLNPDSRMISRVVQSKPTKITENPEKLKGEENLGWKQRDKHRIRI